MSFPKGPKGFPPTQPMTPLQREAIRQRMAAQAAKEEQSSFQQFNASQIYCPKCKQAMPVREKLLLHIPGGDLFDYVCARCGTSVATKTTK